MATHSRYSCLGNAMDRGAWWATVHGSQEGKRVGHDFTTEQDAFNPSTSWLSEFNLSEP